MVSTAMQRNKTGRRPARSTPLPTDTSLSIPLAPIVVNSYDFASTPGPLPTNAPVPTVPRHIHAASLQHLVNTSSPAHPPLYVSIKVKVPLAPLKRIPTVSMKGGEKCKSRFRFEMWSWDDEEGVERPRGRWGPGAGYGMEIVGGDEPKASNELDQEAARAMYGREEAYRTPLPAISYDLFSQLAIDYASDGPKRRTEEIIERPESAKRTRAVGNVGNAI
ncbi:hypothetical protein B9479_004503 [Cryptococcus floricola]|uniref:Uncharacterized protein n=1 Tax=Cryptococcus floricola TaxID=2591691 RepID=A0A5D3AVE9_9TREE|nr:hypothetical protein B9479_004503 [Cryptococcus floricola]